MRRLIVLLASLLLVAGACGADQEVVTQPGGSDPTTPPTPGGLAAGLVISVERGGGFLPMGADFRTPPQAAIYEDGTAFSPAPVAAVYPGPALAPIATGTLVADEVERLVAAADDAGIVSGAVPDFGQPPVADASTTTIRVVADGTEHVVDVYALGLSGGLGEGLPGLTPAQQEARQRIADLVDQVTAAAAGAGSRSWEPDRYRVLPLDPAVGGDLAVAPGEAAWPLDGVALEVGRCVAVDGESATQLAEALGQASEITRWTTTDGGVFQLAVRAVLPHEPGCPA